MSDLSKIAIVTSHMIDLKSRLEHLVSEKESIVEEFSRMEQKLWESEAALGDAERELAFVKGTAIKAIQKLGAALRERESLAEDLDRVTCERDCLSSQCSSLQRHLLSMSRKMERRNKQQNAHCQSQQRKHTASPVSSSVPSSVPSPVSSPVSPDAYGQEDAESDSSWTVVA